MFCPKCATQNLEGASYCRVCGANISLVPQALTGQLPQATDDNSLEPEKGWKRRNRKQATLDAAFKNVFMGIAFLLVSVALSFSIGRGWWFWMLIPAFSMIGTGIAQYIRVKEKQNRAALQSGPIQPSIQPISNVNTFTAPNTGQLTPPPPSVTEGTTRHLGAEAPTRHFDPSSEEAK